MSSSQPQIEFLPNPSLAQDMPPPPQVDAPRVTQRPWVFTGVFLLCLGLSLAYVWLRQPIYQSAASVLTVAPTAIDQDESKANAQHTTVQQKTLLGQPMLEETRRRLSEEGGIQHVTVEQRTLLGEPLLEETQRRLGKGEEPSTPIPLTVDELREMLSVELVPETNVVELRARGPDKTVLAPVVNAWIDAYQTIRGRSVRENKDTTSAVLQREFEAMGRKIEAKRQELDRFRRDHDILSEKDSDNQARARLTGLNTALNKASELEVEAKTKLEAVKEAIAQGKVVVMKEEEASVSNLERRVQELREQVKDLKKRYTPQYVALQPQLKLLPEQLAQAEAEIHRKVEENRRAVLNQAEQEYAAAHQAVAETRRRLDDNKRDAAEFTARFAEFTALSDELEELEKMYKETQARLVHVESKAVDEFPQLQVVERGYPPRKPLWPDYWRDSGIAVAGSLSVALFFLLVYDFVLRREGQSALFKLPDIRIFNVPENLMLRHRDEDIPALPPERAVPALAENQTPALESPGPRHLSEPELRMLLDAASLDARQLMSLLLSGLTLEEVAQLEAENFELSENRLLVGGTSPRSLPLAPRLKHWLTQTETLPAWAGELETEPEELAALIACAAADAGVPEPGSVDAAALRHTYIVYLVRQGIRLADLERVVGKLPARTLAGYARHSPAGPGLRAEAVPLVFPLLRDETLG